MKDPMNDSESPLGAENLPDKLVVDSLAGMTPADRLFAVIEYSSFFAVRHLPSGAECPMGDGVDTLFRHDEEGARTLTPGTEGFVQEWEASLNADPEETLEAYFPELVDREPWGCPRCNPLGPQLYEDEYLCRLNGGPCA